MPKNVVRYHLDPYQQRLFPHFSQTLMKNSQRFFKHQVIYAAPAAVTIVAVMGWGNWYFEHKQREHWD